MKETDKKERREREWLKLIVKQERLKLKEEDESEQLIFEMSEKKSDWDKFVESELEKQREKDREQERERDRKREEEKRALEEAEKEVLRLFKEGQIK